MVSRIYVEKKPGFDVEAPAAQGRADRNSRHQGHRGPEGYINRYDIGGIDEELFRSCADRL